ncbi:MAG TPA: aldehyde dehydrogenase family protein [Thermomicrobiales bacterium]|nr:aldehyde dehydrogenase family protein [Thermomicrobiales bacterium]
MVQTLEGTREYGHYIGGKWTDARAGATFQTHNPATGEPLATYAKGTPADVDAAVGAAAAAFKSWRLVPAPKRGEILFRAGQLLAEHKEQLAREMTQEMGKVLTEARGDVQEGIDMAFYMAGEGRRMFGHQVPAELPNKWAMAVRKPLGVVAAITPWNFPMAIPTWKIMPALVAGNTVVFKPATYTPLLAVRLAEIFAEAGLPGGVLNLVLGSGGEVGDAIMRHPDVALVTFTGSTETGDRIALEAARTRKRLSMELGGKNAIIVMDDADLDLALEGIVWSAFGTSGQRCTAASRVIVHRAVERDLADLLVARVAKLRLGNGLDDATDVGPVISHSQLERIHGYMDVGRQEGAAILVGGDIATVPGLEGGAFHQPTIFGGATARMRVSQEEIFGPVTTLIPVDSFDEAIDVANGVQYGLSAAIYTADVNRAFRAMQDIFTGILYVNAGTIGAEIQLPFGGTKATGNGHREAGQAALDVVTEWQAIYVDYSGKLQRAQIDT